MRVDAELILSLRTARGWSQEELARASGLNLRTVQRIENTAAASLQSKRAIASAFDINLQDLDDKEPTVPTCPECKSEDVFQYNDLIDTTTIGGELLPKLASGRFSSAKMRAVVCGDCGFLRYFVADDALEKLKSSTHWSRVVLPSDTAV